MKRYLRNLLFVIVTLFICVTSVNAASSATIKTTSSVSNIVTGKTFTVTITTSSSDLIGVIEYSVSYDNKILKLTNTPDSCSSTYCTWKTSTGNDKTQSYTFTFKAIGSGTSTIGITDARVVGYDEKNMNTTSKTASVKVMTEEELQATYSSNNNLSSLSVKGYSLSPTFSKDVTKYKIEVDETVEKIKISAAAEDSKATVTGTGNKKVSEGDNKLKVVVTAENGTKKTYVITATVKALNPIKVKIDDKEYTLIKKATNLPTLDNYTLTEVEIEDTQIPAYYSEISNYTIVGLKDSEGNTKLFIYDVYNETYTEYVEIKFNGTTLQILSNDKDVPDGYTKTNMVINDVELTAYKDNNESDFALIYGMNTSTGKKGFYKYDSVENTVQRFNERKQEKSIINNITTEDNKTNMFLIIGIGILSFILLIVVIVSLAKPTKRKRR